MQESREESQIENKDASANSKKALELFVEKVKDDITRLIEDITLDDIQKFQSQLTPDSLEFFNACDKEKDPIAAKTRYLAIHTVLDRLTPEEFLWIQNGVDEEQLPILHNFRNMIFLYKMEKDLTNKGKQKGIENFQH